MKHTAILALMLNLGVAGVYAQQHSVKMVFSGTNGASAVDLLEPKTNNAEENYAGDGSLGRFTFRDVRAIAALPQQSSTCSGPNKFYFPSDLGGGYFASRMGVY